MLVTISENEVEKIDVEHGQCFHFGLSIEASKGNKRDFALYPFNRYKISIQVQDLNARVLFAVIDGVEVPGVLCTSLIDRLVKKKWAYYYITK